ncbi:MAG TPA: class I SAM-dependent methyltransferase [Thermoanaerobaculia bacterium]|nr:class I SAM-dependent methyltransferase [Thermoanaerobaculia bacterium]
MTQIAPHPPLREYYGEPANREQFVKQLFDDSAPWYEWATGVLSLGSGNRYRRKVLARAGVKPGQRVLDIATGTGGVARAAAAVTGDPRSVFGLDPSIGMLLAGRQKARLPNVQGTSAQLPYRGGTFDVITIGYALRHFADLEGAFRECRRILRPQGKLVILEITAPASRTARLLLGAYMGALIPAAALAVTRRARVAEMMRYYWATTRHCVRPEVILAAMAAAGFRDPTRSVELGIFSEYSGRM